MSSKLHYLAFVVALATFTKYVSAQSNPDENLIDRVRKFPSLNSAETDNEMPLTKQHRFRYSEPFYRYPLDFEKRSSNDDEDGDNDLLAPSDRNTQFPSKRAPPGFMGVRGKKFLAELIRINNNNHNNNIIEDDLNDEASDHPLEFKRVPNGFMGMRGKKEFFVSDAQIQNIRQWMQQHRDEMGQGGEGGGVLVRAGTKRDPVKGFMGVRGKRLLERLAGLGLSGEDGSKRGGTPSLGFVGMRGKKWDESADYN